MGLTVKLGDVSVCEQNLVREHIPGVRNDEEFEPFNNTRAVERIINEARPEDSTVKYDCVVMTDGPLGHLQHQAAKCQLSRVRSKCFRSQSSGREKADTYINSLYISLPRVFHQCMDRQTYKV